MVFHSHPALAIEGAWTQEEMRAEPENETRLTNCADALQMAKNTFERL